MCTLHCHFKISPSGAIALAKPPFLLLQNKPLSLTTERAVESQIWLRPVGATGSTCCLAPMGSGSAQLRPSSGSCQPRHVQLPHTEVTQTGVGTETSQTAFGMCCDI